ncbi:MAG: PorP/SprF family type IX secretion system membrane protein [Bacteroidia bacterium]
MEKKLICFFLFISSGLMAQDPFFSQYNSNAIYLNPAFAGSFENGIFTAAYRSQWPGFRNSYQTLNFSFNKYYSKVKGGLGINYFYDSAGDGTINTQNVQIMYAPNIQLNNSIVIKPAVSLGYAYKTLDWRRLTFGDNIDPRYGFTYPAFTNPPLEHVSFFDISSGILIYNNFFSAGAAFNHINEPDQSFIKEGTSPLPIRYTIHGSLNFSIHAKDTIIRIEPSVVYSKQGNTDFNKIGFALKYKCFLSGIYFQENYTNTSLMIGFEKNQIRVSYGFDFGYLNDGAVTSHEFFISYSLPNKKQKTDGMLFNNSFAF